MMSTNDLRILSTPEPSNAKLRLGLITLVAASLSSVVHIQVWQFYEQLMAQTKAVIETKSLEFALMQAPPPPPKIEPPPPPKPVEPIVKPTPPPVKPILKPLPKPIAVKKIAPVVKAEPKPEPIITAPPKAPEPSGGGGGYGIESKTAQSNTGTGVGITGGAGSGSGGGVGTGKGTGVGSGTGASDVDSKGFSTNVVVLERIPPEYPKQALRRGIEGKVTIQFVIRPDGSVDNPVIVNAEPSDIFEEAALEAIQKWKFKQKIVNGVAVEQRTIQTLAFKLKNRRDTDE